MINRPKGTNDILPEPMEMWHTVEEVMRQVCHLYGYQEIRTPIFEHTELFHRGVGETTDIVEKEMYTFLDKGDRSITLRPEGTAPVVRAFVENRAYAEAQPTRYYYQGPMFRYSRPQAGRYRQFNQFGVEAFGTMDPLLDAEVISLCMDFFHRLGLTGLELHINSVGCPACRPVHRQALKDYLAPSFRDLCPTCQQRYETNPLRIFDCKSPTCQEIVKDAPTITSCLCDSCREHLDQVEKGLEMTGVSYVLDTGLVRGLDYYTKTAFEVMVSGIGAQSSIGGGGRYDQLVAEIGGPEMSGIGFAVGLERTILTMEAQGIGPRTDSTPQVYIAHVTEKEKPAAFRLAATLRQEGISARTDVMDRSLKAQFKYADRQGFTHVITLGETEAASGMYGIKDMLRGSQEILSAGDLIRYLQGGNDNE